MSLKEDLIHIANDVSAVLDGCNSQLVSAAASLRELPPKLEQTLAATYDTAFSAGAEAGRAEGEVVGRGTAYDEFWDAFQDNGNRTKYGYEFMGDYWTDVTFKPKYPIVAKGDANQLFYGCRAFEFPTTIDTSGATSINYLFCTCYFRNLPVIDARSVPKTTKLQTVLYNCPYLESVEKVYLHGGETGSSFTRLNKLVEIRFEGEFVASISFSSSTKLSRESIESIYGALSDTAGMSANTVTLSKTAVDKAFETADGANNGSTAAAWEALYLNTPWSTVLS